MEYRTHWKCIKCIIQCILSAQLCADTKARTSTVQCRASSCCGCCIIDSALSFATKSHLVGANCLLASFTHVENYSVTYAHIVLTPRLAPAARINAPFSASRIDPDTTYLAPSARINTHSLKCRIAPVYFWPNKKQHVLNPDYDKSAWRI